MKEFFRKTFSKIKAEIQHYNNKCLALLFLRWDGQPYGIKYVNISSIPIEALFWHVERESQN